MKTYQFTESELNTLADRVFDAKLMRSVVSIAVPELTQDQLHTITIAIVRRLNYEFQCAVAAPVSIEARREFTCPECGSHSYGSSGCIGPIEAMIGHCHGDNGCKFSWPRSDDDKYFSEGEL
jgi:hypothetical protein